MISPNIFRIVTVFLVFLLSLPAFAEPGKDHPLINRFPDTTIRDYAQVGYEEMQFILSKPYKKAGEWTADKLLPLAGKVTYIHYEVPKKYSDLQVFRNYQKAIKRQGMEVLFNCERTCVKENLGSFDSLLQNHQDFYLNYGFEQYIVAKKANQYLALWVNDGGVWQFIVEQEELDDTLISPMAQAISETGKVDLYGIYFDTGKSIIKPQSKDELSELAATLKAFPKLKVDIIGHTDNVGDTKANLKLSAERAAAVLNSLVKTYGVDASRLNPVGMGEAQPLMDNKSPQGRAKNRRVEIAALNPEVISGKAQSASTPRAEEQQLAEKEAEKQEAEKKEKLDLEKQMDKAKKLKDKFKGLF